MKALSNQMFFQVSADISFSLIQIYLPLLLQNNPYLRPGPPQFLAVKSHTILLIDHKYNFPPT